MMWQAAVARTGVVCGDCDLKDWVIVDWGINLTGEDSAAVDREGVAWEVPLRGT